MGRSMLTKSIATLAECYHPHLHRLISVSSQANSAARAMRADVLQFPLHTLSHAGTLDETGKADSGNNAPFDPSLSPAWVAQAAVSNPWAPEWMSGLIDHKPLPYESTATFTDGEQFRRQPRYTRCYLGQFYGLASIDVNDSGTVPVLAQWQRTTANPAGAQDLGMLMILGGSDPAKGPETRSNGHSAVLQQRNKLIVLTAPGGQFDDVHSRLATTLELFSLQKNPTWTICVDDQPLTALPAHLSASSRIIIKDGGCYLGIIPLPATDPRRDEEIVVQDGRKPGANNGAESCRRSPSPAWSSVRIPALSSRWRMSANTHNSATSSATCARIIWRSNWEEKDETLQLALKSGGDTLELGYRPPRQRTAAAGVAPDDAFTYRRVNGRWPYLPPGIERDSTLSVQGSTGRLEKNDAELTCDPGKMAYLLTDTQDGCYAAYHPLLDPTAWSLSFPGGIHIDADGKVSLLSITAQPRENKLTIDYAACEEQDTAEMATALLVSGLHANPQIFVNGQPAVGTIEAAILEGRRVLIIPLTHQYPGAAKVIERYTQKRQAGK